MLASRGPYWETNLSRVHITNILERDYLYQGRGLVLTFGDRLIKAWPKSWLGGKRWRVGEGRDTRRPFKQVLSP